ncbi:DUF3742 family protein [[Pseudomonas] boreopolis]|uniref:DUF3742 family protein n=1 Tax=Xanthomonas boreopolis TaxID=86183 RepID=UPI003D3C00B6
MNDKLQQHNAARRLGRWVGERHRTLRRREALVVHWMTDCGVPLGLARLLPWTVKVVVLLALLYVAVWLVLLLVFEAVAARVLEAQSQMTPEERGQWRDGERGFGYYEGCFRTDLGNPWNSED